MKKLASFVVGGVLILAGLPALAGEMLSELNGQVMLQTSGPLQEVTSDTIALTSNDERESFRITRRTRICSEKRLDVDWTELRDASVVTVISLPKDDEALSIRLGGLMFTPTMSGVEAVDSGCIPFSDEELAARDGAEQRRQVIRKVQRLLASLDYDVGPVDGLEGPKTRAAIREFERDNDLRISGKVSATLLKALESKLKDARQ